MNIFKLLQQDHAQINTLLDKLSQAAGRATREREQLFREMRRELMLHMVAEENVFYPLLVDEEIAEDLALEAAEEHHLVKVVLEEMAAPNLDAEQWAAKLQVLTELVAHHVGEEEKQLFPKAKGALDREQAENLANQVEAEKASLGKPKSAATD